MIVVDASIVFDYVARGPSSVEIEERLVKEGLRLHAPQLIQIELLSALRGREQVIDSKERIRSILESIRFLPLTLYPHQPFTERIWSLRHNITPYDAAYVALAEVLGAPLLTRDRRLANSSGHRARIEVV